MQDDPSPMSEVGPVLLPDDKGYLPGSKVPEISSLIIVALAHSYILGTLLTLTLPNSKD